MRQKFSFFDFYFNYFYSGTALAESILEINNFQPSKLTERKLIWPDWRLASSIKRPGLKDDLIYPDWFEGVWDVTSKIVNRIKNLLIIQLNLFTTPLVI